MFVSGLLIFGAGYSGLTIARAALAAGIPVSVVSRAAPKLPPGAAAVRFDAASDAIFAARFLVATAPPNAEGDPVLVRWGAEIRAAPLAWLGYLSTTGVYGDRGGGWVDEDTATAPSAARSVRRRAAEMAWQEAADQRPLDLMRLAGIYGPGRSALDEIRTGHARRVIKPGHAFGRIHRDDIAAGVVAAMTRPPRGTRVLNFSDEMPAESAAVLTEAARLLGVAPPPEVAFADAETGMSDMGRSFWAESRLVRSDKTKSALAIAWRYPGYREGLAAIFAEEGGERLA